MKKKVLFIALHELDRAPSQRFRFEQYISFLNNNGFDCSCSYIIQKTDYNFFYKQGSYYSKLLLFARGFIKRIKDAVNASDYDIIFIQREAFMTKHILFEKLFAKSTAKIIFDFDDSIWIQNVSVANKRLSWLKDASKTAKIIALSDMVFAGNQYLAQYALKYNSNVKVVPTTIDTTLYQKLNVRKSNKICIGWSGSFSTVQHFEFALNALKTINEKYKDKVYFKVIGDKNYYNEELKIKGIDWKKDSELEELSEFDIGIMPLPDNDWAKGKCGLKGLQFMALGIPTIMSPVGVNTDIIKDGSNGFLAKDMDEWVEKLSLLIESEQLRLSLGKEGKKTVEERFSVNENSKLYLKYFTEILN
jgi:glycosyltransferase involved in cell wall biosynthesis